MANIDATIMHNARNSFTGKSLTESKFVEARATAEIIHCGIRRNGNFIEKLTDQAREFSRDERFDAMRGETILRDIFKSLYGQTMNQLREELLQRQANLLEDTNTARDVKSLALEHAESIEALIRDGETMPFYKAYDQAGHVMAKSLSITETGAKEIMKTAFAEAHGKDLYETGKAWEKTYHEPVREAARQERAAQKEASVVRPRSRA